jgi:YD repeat-containing protein
LAIKAEFTKSAKNSYCSPSKKQTRSFAYDGYGRLQSETTPEGGTVSYTYTAHDQVQTRSDQRGIVATYSHNTRSLVTGISYNDGGATPAVSFQYDDYGSRSQMTDGEGATVYTYTAYRQLESETRTFTGLSGKTFALNYTYNQADMVTRVNYLNKVGTTTVFDKNVNYAYLQTGSLSGVGTNLIGTDPNSTTNVLNTVAFRGFGALKSLNYGNGRTLTLTYSDQRQSMASMAFKRSDGTDPIINNTYTYFNDGRIQKITDQVDGAYTTTYTYDTSHRLTFAGAGADITYQTYRRYYSYDEWGNLRAVDGNNGGGSVINLYTINYATNGTGAPATNRILNVNGTISYSYDAAGNLTQEGGTTYTYDAASRLKEVGSGGQNTYGYDGDGMRVRKVEAGGAPLYYVRSSVLGQVAMEVNSQGVYRAYVSKGGAQVAL